MSFKGRFNDLKRSAAPYALAFATAATAGCGTVSPRNQMSDEKIQYVQQAIAYYDKTGTSPINYDACTALNHAAMSGQGSQTGATIGGVSGGIAGSQIGGTAATAAGALAGIVLGSIVGEKIGGPNLTQLDWDCAAQTAVGVRAGGSAPGVQMPIAPGGIHGGQYQYQQPYRGWSIPQPRRW